MKTAKCDEMERWIITSARCGTCIHPARAECIIAAVRGYLDADCVPNRDKRLWGVVLALPVTTIARAQLIDEICRRYEDNQDYTTELEDMRAKLAGAQEAAKNQARRADELQQTIDRLNESRRSAEEQQKQVVENLKVKLEAGHAETSRAMADASDAREAAGEARNDLMLAQERLENAKVRMHVIVVDALREAPMEVRLAYVVKHSVELIQMLTEPSSVKARVEKTEN